MEVIYDDKRSMSLKAGTMVREGWREGVREGVRGHGSGAARERVWEGVWEGVREGGTSGVRGYGGVGVGEWVSE